jgi:hypothetical protein
MKSKKSKYEFGKLGPALRQIMQDNECSFAEASKIFVEQHKKSGAVGADSAPAEDQTLEKMREVWRPSSGPAAADAKPKDSKTERESWRPLTGPLAT